MSDELEALKVAAQDAIVNPPPINIAREYAYSLVTFKDGVSTPVPITTDVSQFVAGVDALSASGGGDCPEASDQALMAALNALEQDTDRAGALILVTDASPLTDNRAQVIAKATSLHTPIDVLLTGTCSAAAARLGTQSQGAGVEQAATAMDAESYFSEIAQATGGTFKYAPGASVDEYSKILTDMTFERSYGFKSLNPGYHLVQGSLGSMSYYKVTVPAGHGALNVRALSGTGKVSIFMSKDNFPGQNYADWEGNNNSGSGATGMTVYYPEAGDYYIGVFGRTDYNHKRLVIEIAN